MKCPFCGDQESKVVDSRHSEDGLSIRRRRQCPECGQDPDRHLDSPEFWLPRACDLTRAGVVDRLDAFNADLAEAGRA